MKFFVTTPIYYVNDIPHIGHAYTTIAADILSRYSRLKGNEVFFLTGTDEHGQKVQKAASGKNRSPKEHADLLVENYKALWQKIDISYGAFIRTTDPEHKKVVQELLQKLFNKGEIEKRSYSGWYCTPDERFWTEKDLIDGKCPDCGREVEQIEEQNYFFLMSKYKDPLIKHIDENPDYIMPETRKNEVLGFLRSQSLGDLCISRPKKRLAWGIPLPFDEEFVTYVWFDALVNYYSATRYLFEEKGVRDPWPADVHLIGKDILTTHAVYWSTMLMALDMPLPKTIFAHGWWTVEGKKMSKSVGNVVDPGAMADKYGADAFRYFLFREVPFGLDGDFSEEALVKRTNTDLANDLGNLLSRTLTMIEKYRGGVIPAPIKDNTSSREVGRREAVLFVNEHFIKHEVEVKSVKGPSKVLSSIVEERINYIYLKDLDFCFWLIYLWERINKANHYIQSSEPWKIKDEDELSDILYTGAEFLRLIAIFLYPFMPSAAQEIWNQLGIKESITDSLSEHPEYKYWGEYKALSGTKIEKGKALFPRIETEKISSKKETAPIMENIVETPMSTDNLINIEDFLKVELKTGKVLFAERVPKSKKLIRLEIDTGEKRQVVAGIGAFYTPEELVGKSIVVVTNLKPAKLMGVESQGMLLAATDSEGKLSVLTLDREVLLGAKIK